MVTPTKPNSRLGTYVLKTFKDESFRAYVPPPLPPDPPLALQRLLPLLEQANQALGRLDGLASILPDPSLFIYLYVRKEAVLSSQIEGTQSFGNVGGTSVGRLAWIRRSAAEERLERDWRKRRRANC
jgi:Fic family protein